MIRQADIKDIPQIVDIHLRALPGDLLPRLGKYYLLNELYPQIFKSHSTLNLVSDENGIVNAFCIYAFNSHDLTEYITKDKLLLAKYLSMCLIKDISIIKEVFSLLKGPKIQLFSKNENFLDKGLPEIYIIATDPQYQKRGLGKAIIMEGFLHLFKDHPACLVRTSSENAKNFYINLGFTLFGAEYRGSRILHLLIYQSQQNSNN
jgi:ribosomal protein S18 acetylase RimI-like enzyme